MTTMQHLSDDDLVLRYYGEMEADADASAQSHIAGCAECLGRYTRLQRVMAAVDSLPSPALPEGFERKVWARLEPALARRRNWYSRLLFAPPNLAWAATIVLLVAAAFFAGRLSHQSTTDRQAATISEMRESVLLADLSEHLDRSQMMLVELVNGGSGATAGRIDLSVERDRAEELVAANRLYRQTAVDTGAVPIAELLDDLERLLVEVAAGPDQLSEEDMDRVRQRIAAADLLFKVRVVSSAVREKQKEQIRVRAGQSS